MPRPASSSTVAADRALPALVVRDVMTEVLLRDPALKTALLASNEATAALEGAQAMSALFAEGLERPHIRLKQKLLALNWPFLALLTAITLVGVAALYSVAGGSLEPWASRHVVRYCIGLALLFIVALSDIRLGCARPIRSTSSRF